MCGTVVQQLRDAARTLRTIGQAVVVFYRPLPDEYEKVEACTLVIHGSTHDRRMPEAMEFIADMIEAEREQP